MRAVFIVFSLSTSSAKSSWKRFLRVVRNGFFGVSPENCMRREGGRQLAHYSIRYVEATCAFDAGGIQSIMVQINQ
jgi:hypothetical protein